jgi:hypothetical protein
MESNEMDTDITAAMLQAGLAALESELCEDYLMHDNKSDAVRKIWRAMWKTAFASESEPHDR